MGRIETTKRRKDMNTSTSFLIGFVSFIVGLVIGFKVTVGAYEDAGKVGGVIETKGNSVLIECSDESRRWINLPCQAMKKEYP